MLHFCIVLDQDEIWALVRVNWMEKVFQLIDRDMTIVHIIRYIIFAK